MAIDTAEAFRAEVAAIGLTLSGLARTLAIWGDERDPVVIRRWLQRMADGDAPVADYVRVVLGVVEDRKRQRDLNRRTVTALENGWIGGVGGKKLTGEPERQRDLELWRARVADDDRFLIEVKS